MSHRSHLLSQESDDGDGSTSSQSRLSPSPSTLLKTLSKGCSQLSSYAGNSSYTKSTALPSEYAPPSTAAPQSCQPEDDSGAKASSGNLNQLRRPSKDRPLAAEAEEGGAEDKPAEPRQASAPHGLARALSRGREQLSAYAGLKSYARSTSLPSDYTSQARPTETVSPVRSMITSTDGQSGGSEHGEDSATSAPQGGIIRRLSRAMSLSMPHRHSKLTDDDHSGGKENQRKEEDSEDDDSTQKQSQSLYNKIRGMMQRREPQRTKLSQLG